MTNPNPSICGWIAHGAVLASLATALAHAAPTVDPPTAPSAARAASAAAAAAERARVAPAIQEARESRPLDLRPPVAAAPLLRVPLRRSPVDVITADSDAPVDDSVARCLAERTRAERRDCLIRRPG